jgi:hypothetical protein
MSFLSRFTSALTVVFIGLGSANAASYDPDLNWSTLKTEHFNITFHDGEEDLAAELSSTAERVHEILTKDMKHTPDRPTEVVLVDHTDVANGYAQVLPVNTIVIFVTAPTESSSLGLYEDWLEAIFTHEYAHILHLDTVEGIPKFIRKILGRIISVNGVSPWWIVEGFATYQETRFTTGGRGRAPAAQMIVRMAVLEEMFPELGQMDGWISDPPGGNLRYLFGQSFVQYIADHSSEDAWTRWHHSYGGGVPYWLPAKQVFGKHFGELFADWKGHLEKKYGALRRSLERQGLTEFELISDGEDTCYGPAHSPNGSEIVFSCSDRAEGSAIFSLSEDADAPEVILKDHFAKSITWRADGKAFAFSTPHMVGFFNLYDDIFFHAIGSESAKALTGGKRARDPAFSPDGSDLLMVRNRTQDNNLFRMRIDQSVEALTDYADHTQLSTPRYSPNGQFVVLSKWQGGYRDLWIYTKFGTPYRRLTADTHIDRDPVFSADGKTLFYSSDRTGIPNLFAINMETEQIFQVTNVLGGAFQPSPHPKGGKIAFQNYSTNGFDIALMDWTEASWKPLGYLQKPMIHRGDLGPVNAASTRLENPPESAETEEPETEGSETEGASKVETTGAPVTSLAGHPVATYNPIPSLLPPRFIQPGVYQNAFGFLGVLTTGGVDTLRQYGYSAVLTYRTDVKYLGGGGSVTINRWKPIVSASGFTYTVPYGDIYVESPSNIGSNVPGIESAGNRYWDRRSRASLAMGYPLKSSMAFYGRWSGTLRGPLHTLPESAYRPFLPTRGFISQLSAGLRWGKGGSNTYSISPEGARSVSLNANVTPSWLGSYTLGTEDERNPFNQLQLTGEVREYLDVPFFANHVLALRAAGGVSFGDRYRYGSFRLGGNYGESTFYALPDEYLSLRGWPLAAVSGDWYFLSSAEYRFPLWRIDRGTGTIPVFLRSLHGAVFADIGNAFDDPATAGLPLLGIGSELRLTSILLWGLPVQFRVGYGVAVFPTGGIGPTSPQAWYFRAGTSF